jgi:hypothetical protein
MEQLATWRISNAIMFMSMVASISSVNSLDPQSEFERLHM